MASSHRSVPALAKVRARAMRRAPTEAERALWHALRDRRLASMKWRRQFPLGNYIVDFICLEHRLIVEADGSQHAESVYDAARDAWLRAQGFDVLRFGNGEILIERANALETIFARRLSS